MWANNEVGTVQPVAELAAVAAAAGVPFHTDAVQAVGQVPVDFAASGVAALTVTGHKLGGPIGVGALLLGRDVAVHAAAARRRPGARRALRHARHRRASSAFAVAVEAAVEEPAGVRRPGRPRCATSWSRGSARRCPDAVLNGDPADRLPGNAHFSFPGCEGDALLLLLDAQGIACSTGSACSAGVAQPVHVLLAMGADDDRGPLARCASPSATPRPRADVDALVAALPGRGRAGPPGRRRPRPPRLTAATPVDEAVGR